MSKISSFQAWGIWGYKDISLSFNKDMNFLIGSNGAGKTTVINIICALLSVDVKQMYLLSFSRAIVSLYGNHVIMVAKNGDGNITYSIYTEQGVISEYELSNDEYDFLFEGRIMELKVMVSKISQLSLIPLSRKGRGDNDEHDYFNNEGSDPVDEKLNAIKSALISKFSRQSQAYNRIASNFQKSIFNKLLDVPSENSIFEFNSKIDIEKEASSLHEMLSFMNENKSNYDSSRLDYYLKRLKDVSERDDSGPMSLTDFGVMYNAWRTRSLIADYEILKKKKIEIFRSRDDFFEVFRMFFQNGKTLLLSKKNELVMRTEGGTIGLDKLSSGEKQMIILLGEIYLNDNKDIIYIADEPEVSLHVTWQDKIVDALVKINPKAQFILATHSPDIIGRRRESAIRV